MRFDRLIPATFERRDNRFLATVSLEGRRTQAHVPSSGRLRELLQPGRSIWLHRVERPHRKTLYDLILVEHLGGLVCIDTRLPNALFQEALEQREIDLGAFPLVEREVRLGASRIDFRLSDSDKVLWVEIKSVTLVEQGVALFPDAPTPRGTRHLCELIAATETGDRAAVVFMVQRCDAHTFSPHIQADPLFASTLNAASRAGVQMRAYAFAVSTSALRLTTELPVLLP